MRIQTATATTITTIMPPSSSYPGSPPSPTLTNPDMILPYGGYIDDDDGDDGASSLPRQPYSTDDDWMTGSAAHLQFSIGSAHSLGAMTSTTPIIYGNGTMLSDIGEVTEAESTPGYGRRLPNPAERRMLKQRHNSPMRSSPTGHEAATKRARTHQRKMSMESTSTIRSEGQTTDHFKDFDDGMSVDDSVFQGDDEESVADGYAEEIFASETRRLAKSDAANDRDDEGNSSAALSRRAEEILLNAKKRLNNMEGNLTRARSSLFSHSANSSISIHSSSPLSRSTPSPPSNGRLIPLQLGLPPSKRHIPGSSDAPSNSPGHSRVYSENSIVSKQFTSPNLIRSASAAARYGTPRYSPDTDSEGQMTGARPGLATPSNRTMTPVNIRLEPLTEDEVSPIPDDGKSSGRSSLSPGEDDPTLTRSSSVAQMRDLKDQMHDLKGRLSVLRDRARDDNMKRRSMQSLRTPSPFTAAEQWYTGAPGFGEGNLSSDAVTTYPSWKAAPNSPKSGEDDEREEPLAKGDSQPDYAQSESRSVYEDVSDGRDEVDEGALEPEGAEGGEDIEEEAQQDAYDEEGDYNEDIVEIDEEEDYESDDASLYHDSFPMPISHEDREDAFDYEHFFLHSAMGTISQQRNGRSGSFSSEDSVETTRGPLTATIVDQTNSLSHLRSESSASVSTLATFATATEGFGSDEEEDEDHDNFAVQQVMSGNRALGTTSPAPNGKRSTFGSPMKGALNERQGSLEKSSRTNSMIHAIGDNNGYAQPYPDDHSVVSPDFMGSTRSFPLVNKLKPSPDNNTLLSNSGSQEQLRSSPVAMLTRSDQLLVESVVASVGRCVLGLQEAGPTSYDAKIWRRRLDAARRTLDGNEPVA